MSALSQGATPKDILRVLSALVDRHDCGRMKLQVSGQTRARIECLGCGRTVWRESAV